MEHSELVKLTVRELTPLVERRHGIGVHKRGVHLEPYLSAGMLTVVPVGAGQDLAHAIHALFEIIEQPMGGAGVLLVPPSTQLFRYDRLSRELAKIAVSIEAAKTEDLMHEAKRLVTRARRREQVRRQRWAPPGRATANESTSERPNIGLQ